MISEGKYFVEVDCAQINQKRQSTSADVYMVRRHNNRIIMVMADGGGAGVMYKVRAEVIASMALNYTLSDEPAAHAAETILRTFTDRQDHERRATFTIADIHRGGMVRIVEFGQMPYLLMRRDKVVKVEREQKDVVIEGESHTIYTSAFTARPEHRIVLPTAGVASSGWLTKRLPGGWGRDGIARFCSGLVLKESTVSAHDLGRKIVEQAEINDLYSPKNDLMCGVVYFRTPRRILVCSGPPFNGRKDEILADMVAKYRGMKLICGGTTAQIISRELERPVAVNLRRDPAGLPPTSTMDGVDLVTEGVLTLNRVKSYLEKLEGEVVIKGTDSVVAQMLLENDIIEFVVGTRINPVHQDPDLPVELELRRNLIKDLTRLLETKFMKEVRIQYI